MKFCIIGVGRFGYHVATTLADHGMDVLAVDSNESIIADIRDRVTQAICMRVANEDALRSIGVEDMDTVIVAMGENFAQSILVTALLKQKLRVPRVIVRSISSIHKEILELIGADQVILPEREMGIRLADNLSLSFNALVRIAPHFSICTLKAPEKFVGKRLDALNLLEKYNVSCIALKKNGRVILPDPQEIITHDDYLFCAGDNKDLDYLAQL